MHVHGEPGIPQRHVAGPNELQCCRLAEAAQARADSAAGSPATPAAHQLVRQRSGTPPRFAVDEGATTPRADVAAAGASPDRAALSPPAEGERLGSVAPSNALHHTSSAPVDLPSAAPRLACRTAAETCLPNRHQAAICLMLEAANRLGPGNEPWRQ